MAKPMTEEEFLVRAREVHGDTFDYSNMQFTSRVGYIYLNCEIHGEFKVSGANHINKNNKRGCPKCGYAKTSEKLKEAGSKRFFEKVLKEHPNLDFSSTKYLSVHEEVDVKCPTHGLFKITPTNLYRARGCYECKIEKGGNRNNKDCRESFLLDVATVHGDRYDLSKVDYLDSNTKVELGCQDHGSFFMTPNKILAGQNCYECSRVSRGVTRKAGIAENLVEKFREVHGDNYGYDGSEYKGDKEYIDILCRGCGEVFQQVPSAHKQGQGCPACAVFGFKQHLPAILYYLKVDTEDQTLYKIGITNRTVQQRFSNQDLSKITVLSELHYEVGEFAHKAEQSILKEFSEFKYTGKDILESGNTELFTKDILNRDPNNYEGGDKYEEHF